MSTCFFCDTRPATNSRQVVFTKRGYDPGHKEVVVAYPRCSRCRFLQFLPKLSGALGVIALPFGIYYLASHDYWTLLLACIGVPFFIAWCWASWAAAPSVRGGDPFTGALTAAVLVGGGILLGGYALGVVLVNAAVAYVRRSPVPAVSSHPEAQALIAANMEPGLFDMPIRNWFSNGK